MSDRPGPGNANLYLCIAMIVNDWQSWSWDVNVVFVYWDDC